MYIFTSKLPTTFAPLSNLRLDVATIDLAGPLSGRFVGLFIVLVNLTVLRRDIFFKTFRNSSNSLDLISTALIAINEDLLSVRMQMRRV